ncbi:MAG: hypothetical protein MSA15_13325 [Clostridium sp.]|nr:hypothetical protein [Clostridium sp.]
MSNYTIELRFLETPPVYNVFDFDYVYYMKGLVSDEVYEQKKKEFENKFIDFYYFDEIGYNTPDRFKQRLKNYLDMGFKKWQERYKTELEVEIQKINFLLNKDLIEERITEGNATGNSSTTSSSTSNNNSSANNKNTVNDTPDTRFTSTENFATSITNDESTTNSSNTINGETRNTSNQNSNVNERFTSKGNIGVTSSAELLEKWREVIIDIDNEIIENADMFFMQIL